MNTGNKTYFYTRSPHCADIILILRFENLDNVRRKCSIASALDMYTILSQGVRLSTAVQFFSPKTHLGSFLDHGKVEFILISFRCLLLEAIEAVLLRVVIPCALDIVLMFL